ncbi:MAG: ATP-binding protein [Burkholderiales bacterium]
MDPRTLTLYLLAGGLSLGLAAVLRMVAHFNPDGRLAKYSAYAVLLSATGFVISGFTPDLPRWVIVIGANWLLLASCSVLYSAFRAYVEDNPPRPDRAGLGLVALSMLAFWYWGLVEPNGNYRSALFSFVTAIFGARGTLLFLPQWQTHKRNPLRLILVALFGLVTLWMMARGTLYLWAPAPNLRGANPTSWVTVFWYIVFLSVLVVCIIWIEIGHKSPHRRNIHETAGFAATLIEYFRRKFLLLWSVVAVVVMALISEAGIIYTKSYEWEEARLVQSTELTNEALVLHSAQMLNQVDTLLHSVRNFYLRTHSYAETDAFIDSLPLDKSTIDNVYLINADGDIVLARAASAPRPSAADRDYFRFHQSNPTDQIYIGSVESGLVTGNLHFRVTRRISHPNGSFAGVILATIKPQALSSYCEALISGTQNSCSLLGLEDRKIRARYPEPPADLWQVPLESPLWNLAKKAPSGTYNNTSKVDNVERIFAYKKVPGLPLIMVTGFSAQDVTSAVHARLRWIAVGALTLLLVILTLAGLLTIEIKRRNEQDQFMSMLSHELKTPLSVLRMALGNVTHLSAGSKAHAQQSVQDMDAIIERCLQADRMEHHRHVPSQQLCSVSELMAELQSSCSSPARLQIETADLPAFSTDPALLRIALNNLLDNALKYSPKASTVQVRAGNHTHRHHTGVLFSVSNTAGAAGMPDPRRVFGKYYRSPGAHSKTGSGLGLYLVRDAARQLGGWVRYAPIGQEQVCFELWLPV